MACEVERIARRAATIIRRICVEDRPGGDDRAMGECIVALCGLQRATALFEARSDIGLFFQLLAAADEADRAGDDGYERSKDCARFAERLARGAATGLRRARPLDDQDAKVLASYYLTGDAARSAV